MKQKFQMRPRTIHFISSFLSVVFSLSLCSTAALGQDKEASLVATEPQEEKNEPSPKPTNHQTENEQDDLLVDAIQSASPKLSVPASNSLEETLNRFAQRATEQLRPDVRNGLIRVAVLTTQGQVVDEPTRQALAMTLAQKIRQQPNILILEPSRAKEVLSRFEGTGLVLSDNRSISLGQHLGVRYLVITEVVSGSTSDTFTLKTKTVSVKRRGPLKSSEDEAVVSSKEMMSFKTRNVFYERKLEATWRSALLPGWGQLYQGDRGTAVAYMTLSAGLLIGGFWATQAGDDAAGRYQENTPNTIYYRQLANNHYARAQLLWGALGATWFASTLSAYLQGEDRPHIMLNLDPKQGRLGFSGVF
jgi:hypothetical protein